MPANLVGFHHATVDIGQSVILPSTSCMIYVTYVLDHMAVIADEEECTTLWQVDLHSDQAVGVTWQMVESDTLAEIKAALVESLPVPVMTGQSTLR